MALVASAQALGLDIGTSRLVIARKSGEEIQFDSQLNAFVTIPYSKMTENVLRSEHIPHTVINGQIIVQGNESEKFAGLLNVEIRRPMTRGILDPSEHSSLQVIRELLANLLGFRDPFRERRVTFSVPAPPLGAEESLTFHEKTIKQILADLGYEGKPINEGLAVVYGVVVSHHGSISVESTVGLGSTFTVLLPLAKEATTAPAAFKAGEFPGGRESLLIVDDEKRHKRIVAFLDKVAPELVPRVRLHQGAEPLFEAYGIEQQISRALERRVPLPSGGNIVIDHTEALTVIDVNTGKNVGTSNLEETVFRNNLEAAEEVAKQLRLRDIGGIVVIDFIDMEIKENRRKVVEAFRSALARDKTRTQVFDISELGLVEMTRKRIGEGLLVNFADRCPNCDGRGLVIDHELLA